jgi:hypothetical protein
MSESAVIVKPKRLTEGWTATGISRFSTGFPVTLSETDDCSLTGGIALDYPDVVGPVVIQNNAQSAPIGPNTYFLPSSFTLEGLGPIGNAAARFFHGPGIINTDFGLQKTIAVRESM